MKQITLAIIALAICTMAWAQAETVPKGNYSAPLPPEGGVGNALTTCFLNK